MLQMFPFMVINNLNFFMYDDYCFMPLYVFSGDFLLAAKLRPSNIDAAKGTTEIWEKLVLRIREHFPDVNIIFRGDSGFCRDDILSLCESLQISYVIGISRNSRLTDVIQDQMAQVKKKSQKEEKAVREFRRFEYQTKDSWEKSRSPEVPKNDSKREAFTWKRKYKVYCYQYTEKTVG